jgi:hypothetical protein
MPPLFFHQRWQIRAANTSRTVSTQPLNNILQPHAQSDIPKLWMPVCCSTLDFYFSVSAASRASSLTVAESEPCKATLPPLTAVLDWDGH